MTTYLGIDLAWGEKNPTGVAVLDAACRLLHVSAVRTDDEIEAAAAPYAGGKVVAGIDAPLVVTNPTGSRPAEQALSADFRKFHAGTHPSNTGKPEFANGTRGARVAQRLGLAVHETALEVYPHAAIVALFDLDRILTYKDKRGRDLEHLRTELLRLMRAPRRRRHDRRELGRPCVRPSTQPPARASCAWSRTRSTRSSAPTSRGSPTGIPNG